MICGGEPITRVEVAGHLPAGRPLLAVAGSGGVAGELPGTPSLLMIRDG